MEGNIGEHTSELIRLTSFSLLDPKWPDVSCLSYTCTEVKTMRHQLPLQQVARLIVSIGVALFTLGQDALAQPLQSGDTTPDIVQRVPQFISPFNLTGTWTADDEGIYYVRQVDNTVWWVG